MGQEEKSYARLNQVNLLGAIIKPPVIFSDYALIWLTVSRGERDITSKKYIIKHDNPAVVTDDPKMLEEISSWQVNDIIAVKGVFSSKVVSKSSFCHSCDAKNTKSGIHTYVYPIHAVKIASLSSPDDCLKYLEKHRAMSNSFLGFGSLIRDPKVKTPRHGLHLVQFPIVMYRKFYIASDPPEVTKDCAWVKLYGDMAIYNLYRLRKGSVIYIDGYLQARNVKQHTICEKCGTQYSWVDRTLEVVPYYNGIEYISYVRTEDEVQALKAEKDNEILERAGLGRWVTLLGDSGSTTEGGLNNVEEL